MKVAAVQMDVFYGKVEANVSKISRYLRVLKQQGVDLAVFPEASLTGYCADSSEEAYGIAIKDDPSGPVGEIQQLCNEIDICAVIGYAELDGRSIFNTASYLEPRAPARKYRKTHLPYLGLDRFVFPGDELPVWETKFGRIGLLICFDLRMPEAARTLALKGADLIILPTNWPEGAEVSAEHIAITRAAENKVFLVSCNRVGVEKGFRFIGKSKIIHATGRILAAAEAFEIVIMAELDPAEAREKRQVVKKGVYEFETFRSRRLDLYRYGPEA